MRGKRARWIRKYVDSVDLDDGNEDNPKHSEEEVTKFKKGYARKLRRWWNRNIDRNIITFIIND